ncbi:MAG TPA: manganese efflux pump [Firmicutes bacterium]|nr:manganese efflux pump [Bacillota bacterium]
MSIIHIVLIALSLAMDAFTVALAYGFSLDSFNCRHPLFIAATFGFFQASMPVAGWLAGRTLAPVIKPVDHWIVFALLLFVGLHMIREGFATEKTARQTSLSVGVLLALGVATSIDALALGLTFALLDVSILWPVAIIGGITFVASWIAVYIGRIFGMIFGTKINIVGGVILIGIGTKIWMEHFLGGF